MPTGAGIPGFASLISGVFVRRPHLVRWVRARRALTMVLVAVVVQGLFLVPGGLADMLVIVGQVAFALLLLLLWALCDFAACLMRRQGWKVGRGAVALNRS